ncbi:cytosolic 5'-nucleotidase 1A-like isoform X1 [Antechinus flavipes]|uniref:cytosolic 5'-nucleotidase 1A-like isoform X1 n=1 Tax=Antechinus flavipes TaxID=38775 RepID=UPI00223602DB|nr:cytosolic 5'-nucleotidase 1A-like isoform X1 [Antechinus flavipes]XP_051823238.1 cytosolic 5'-nucleotidase 1A-like isoform X1 [Antechinus flavipes]XP_051823239.1 cytosolic 5'-nucleotidase 1A-like isoform X1 [Antechinus flavipes]XP_051823240.1 cytosolic 5'-nucleotidase 1A-like isoform X1 [Antechinus flavipes]
MAAPEAVILNPDVAQKDPREALVVAVTARATFDLEAEHQLFLAQGPEEYTKYQREHATEPLPPGTAFPFIQAVQLVNQRLLERDPQERGLLDVMVLSNNSPEAGRRIVHCARQAGLEISKFCFVSAEDSTQYLREHNVGLFLSADRTDVCNALKRGVPAALLFQQEVQAPSTQLRLAFDGDAVLFSDETDRVFRERGLQGAAEYEKALEAVPIGDGPLKAFALRLGRLRDKFGPEDSPVRTYLVTARSRGDMSVRALNTLRAWGLRLDEVFFMDGAPKGPTLARVRPHIFFDDSMSNIRGAQDAGVPSALVPCDC